MIKTIESTVIALDKQQLTELAADLLLLAEGKPTTEDGQDFAVLKLGDETVIVICEERKFEDICATIEADEVN